MILLKSSDPKGQCYVETKNLDGETNLKLKTTEKDAAAMFQTKTDKDILKTNFGNIRGDIECESPNNAIYKFNGTWTLPGENKKIPLSIDQMILRGSSLRNTDFIIGVVIYQGHDTKVM